MTSQEKKQYNYENEHNYHFAPFSEARRDLRKLWNQTRKCWESFLFENEIKYQKKMITELKAKIYLTKEDRELFLNANRLIAKINKKTKQNSKTI